MFSRDRSSFGAFALYEVMLGVFIFVVGIIALGHSIQHCLNASSLNAEDDRIRLFLANRMAEIQTTPGVPEASKKTTVDSGYGDVEIIQKVTPAGLKEEDDTELNGINTVTLTAHWKRQGIEQSRSIEFYVYRNG